MDIYFVCLTNSYIQGGRCVAGIQVKCLPSQSFRIVRNSWGTPLWVRPISHETDTGEIPIETARTVHLLDVIKLEDAEPCGRCAHSEDVYFSRMVAVGKHYMLTEELMDRFVDASRSKLFYNFGKAIPPEAYQRGSYSILLIRAEEAEVYAGSEGSLDHPRYHVRFLYHDHTYDLPITDPVYLHELRFEKRTLGRKKLLFITCSLGLEHKGWHHKQASTIFELNAEESSDPLPLAEKAAVATDWFDEYEQELLRLMKLKQQVESEISELRQRLKLRMESQRVETVRSANFTVSYAPSKTVMRFDVRSFKTDHEELYRSYCKPQVRESNITVKRTPAESEESAT